MYSNSEISQKVYSIFQNIFFRDFGMNVDADQNTNGSKCYWRTEMLEAWQVIFHRHFQESPSGILWDSPMRFSRIPIKLFLGFFFDFLWHLVGFSAKVFYNYHLIPPGNHWDPFLTACEVLSRMPLRSSSGVFIISPSRIFWSSNLVFSELIFVWYPVWKLIHLCNSFETL